MDWIKFCDTDGNCSQRIGGWTDKASTNGIFPEGDHTIIKSLGGAGYYNFFSGDFIHCIWGYLEIEKKYCPIGKILSEDCECIDIICDPGTMLSDEGTCLPVCGPGTAAVGDSCVTCAAGTYSDGVANAECKACPSQKLIENSLLNYTGASSLDACGKFKSAGYWSLAAQGSAGISWALSKTESTSEGVEHSEEFAEEFTETTGKTTSFESSQTIGASAQLELPGPFSIGFSIGSSIETTSTEGNSYHYEVSESATEAISKATSQVITNEESVACSQTCPDNEEVKAFIFNWVEALYDMNKQEVVHYVRTCITWCKHDKEPPNCPPGYCADVGCHRCDEGAFKDGEIDKLASATNSPTANPFKALSVPPTSNPVSVDDIQIEEAPESSTSNLLQANSEEEEPDSGCALSASSFYATLSTTLWLGVLGLLAH